MITKADEMSNKRQWEVQHSTKVKRQNVIKRSKPTHHKQWHWHWQMMAQRTTPRVNLFTASLPALAFILTFSGTSLEFPAFH
jgi:hypothetical protein